MKILDFLKQNAEKLNGKLTDEQAQTVSKALEELGYNVLVDDTKNPGYLPKSRYDEVNTRKKELETQIGDLKKVVDEYTALKPQLEAMKAAASENPLLKQQLDDLQKKIETYPTQIQELQKKNEEWEGKYKQTEIDNAIKFGLVSAKVNPKYTDLLMTKFDKSKLEYADGNIKGLDDQLKSIQENFKELFGDNLDPNGGANPPGGGGNEPKDESKMTDAEWFAYKQSQQQK